MAQSVSIRQSLMRNLVVVVVLLGAAILATTYAGSRQIVRLLSQSLTDQTIIQTEAELAQFFDPVTRALRVARAWGRSGLLDTDDPDAIRVLLEPLLQEISHISSIMVADGRGREYWLLRDGCAWTSRQTRRDEWGVRTLWREWDGCVNGDAIKYWKDVEYDPRTRPWFQGATAKAGAPAETSPADTHRGSIYWTEPYTFFTTQEPGITAAITFDAGDGLRHVVGFDVALRDITEFTRTLRVLAHGKVTVVTADRRTIGLPAHAKFRDEKEYLNALLQHPDELGIPVMADGIRRFLSQDPGRYESVRFISGGEPWWGGARPFHLSTGNLLWIAVVVPESDLIGGLVHLRVWIVVITTIVLAIGILRAISMARRYSRPIEYLVRQSDRIAAGDLASKEPIRTEVREVSRLAQAQERMRVALRSLVKLESDLALARQIQQSTFPSQLPRLDGFEMAAWSEPAEETGGDTYDVIGLAAGNGRVHTDTRNGKADRAFMLIADATGHGIGPALSVTQVRAMLRMGVRSGLSMEVIARRMNEQLCADLHDSRFITAWLGELNANDAVLTSFSAGQAPLLHYRAAKRMCDSLTPDAPPLGVLEDLPIQVHAPIHIAPGDVFAALSDGVFEATNQHDELFGVARVRELLRREHKHTARYILEQLRNAVQEFSSGTTSLDDRTAIIVKRVL